MSTLVYTSHRTATRPTATPAAVRTAIRVARAVLAWPARVYANRVLLNQMAGMSARDLKDIGLTYADVRDTAAVPLDGDIGAFLATRAGYGRRARNDRWM